MKHTQVHSLALLCACAALLAGCATEYKSSGFSGGFTDTQLAPDMFRIAFQGNGFTSTDRAKDLALLRAADLTLSHGFRYFAILNESDEIRTANVTIPGHAYTTTDVSGYGRHAYATSTTTYTPAQNIEIAKPRSGLLVRCFTKQPRESYGFDAQFLSNSLRQKYRIKPRGA